MIDEEIKLSVIVPVYNVEPYLRKCLDSILNQTYHVDETICVDDGSTDNSLLITEEYAVKFHNMKVVHKYNGGIVSARKAGLQIAKESTYLLLIRMTGYRKICMKRC